MTDFIVHDATFSALVIGHAKLERLWTGARWVEGPVYVPAAKSLLFSDIPNDRIMRFDECDGNVSVFETPCGFHNGHSLDQQGRVIACEHGGRQISRLDHDGQWRALVETVDGKRFNSPNDVVVHSDGSIWFSDPTYGIDSHYEGHRAVSEIGTSDVYRFDPADGTCTSMISDCFKPNGLCFSPDESLLYVSDTGASHDKNHPVTINAYPMQPDKTPGAGRAFAHSPAGLFDGFRVDDLGNIWTSTATGVSIYNPEGKRIGEIPIPELVSNLTFGGPKKNRLYITAQTSLYAMYVNAHGA